MAAPVTGEDSLAGERSDPPLTKSFNSADDNIIIAQLTKISNTQPNGSSSPASYKRRKSKPVRFEVKRTDGQKELPSPKIKIVVGKSSSPPLSLKKISPTKKTSTPIPTPPIMIRAEELQSSLGTKFPSCVKMMVRSQVTYGFWMGLPLTFCRSFLPKEDATLILEDEIGKQWEVKYFAYKNGISAGWRNFVAAHNIKEGDVVIFQLIESLKLKIYIIKPSESNEVDGAIGLMNLDVQNEELTPVTPTPIMKKSGRPPASLSSTIAKKKLKKTPSITPPKPIDLPEHSSPNTNTNNSSTSPSSEVLESSTPFHNFNITVNNHSLESELPDSVKKTYYNLCTYNKQLLHDNLREGLYHKLVAGMIGETVNIADNIKNCKLTTSKEEFEAWDNSLRSFEMLGMKVGFLREKIRTLVRLVFESEFSEDIKTYMEAKSECKVVEEEIKKVKGRLLELKGMAKNCEGVLGRFKEKAEKYMIEFREEVSAPW